MENIVKKLRKSVNKSQSEFASTYNIPLSTLKKWEQNESKPAPYFLSLLTSSIYREKTLVEISDAEHCFYYDPISMTVYNKNGDFIKINYDVLKVKKNNLIIYLDDVFKEYQHIKNEFIIKCDDDQKEGIEWRRVK